MKLTNHVWLNVVILKIVEGLGVVFIPYSIGLIPLAIWPKLQQNLYLDSVCDIWFVGLMLIIVPVTIFGFGWGVISLNLDFAKNLKRD